MYLSIGFIFTYPILILALGQSPSITTSPSQNDSLLQLAGSSVDGQILLSASEWWGVIRAAEDLSVDLGKITGRNLTLGSWSNGEAGYGANESAALYQYRPVTSFVNYTLGSVESFVGPILQPQSQNSHNTLIIAGTIGKSPLISALISARKLNASAIDGQWESFITEVITSPLPGVDRALVIAGSDQRGTIYGLYDISEQAGVSPWWWFADVPVKKAAGVWALGGRKVQGSPSVKYRGFFINDEQPGLTNWINVNYAPGKYGAGFNHYFYSHVFELLLRLRANYLWPAMWGSMFDVDDTASQPLADAYGVVMGTSHTEPMMRATNEWSNFGAEYGGNGQWEYDTNNASLIPFFTYGAQRAKPYAASSLFTMAMRGSGDTAITLTQPEAIAVLENVVTEQRKVLTQVFNDTNLAGIPQMWCLYKEVQGYYEAGMTVPEDITLLWADDNWGNVRRLPLANETDRAGGAGVYYHVDYVGDPRDYKWINTIQLEKTVEQMQMAYTRQADRIWILNVGDIKPLEIPINHFMDLAYDTPKWGYNSVPAWLEAWATREFSSELSANISSVVDRYGMYAARRKYELLDPTFCSVINYNEADTILGQWSELATDAQAIYDKLDEAYQSAFYEMILQPVLGGQVVNEIYIGAAKNELFVEQKRNQANSIAQSVLSSFNQDHVLTQKYHDLLDGKWSHMLDQTHLGYNGYWQQPMRNTLPPLGWVQELETSLAGNIGIGVEASNATVSGDDAYHTNSGDTLILPPLEPFGPQTRWIDIFARGTSDCKWTLIPNASFVTLSATSGVTGGANGSDARVYISVDWRSARATTLSIAVNSSCPTWGNYPAPTVQVPIITRSIPSSFASGFVESDSTISIEAEHSTKNTSTGDASHLILSNYGRTLSGVTLMPVTAPSQDPVGSGPVLEYGFYTFTSISNANITLYLSPSLNAAGTTRPLRYAIAIDNEAPQIRQFVANATQGSLPTGWGNAVADGVWGLSSGSNTETTHDLSVTGTHVLKIWLLEPAVVLQKIICDLGGVRTSYLGPPESFRAGVDVVGKYSGLNFTSSRF